MKQDQAARLRCSSPKKLTLKFASKTKAIWADQRGVAAIEFGFFAVFLSFALANVTDVSIYVYQRMQVENATQVAAQAALKTCSSHLPATTNCSGLTTAVNNALGSTSLGTSVSLITGSPSEGYYCVNSSNALQFISSVSSSKPADCTAAGTPSLQPGDYIQVQTTFSYTPLFGSLSVASAFATPITSTAMLRLG
jgi:Flp pilus assembly protein TadG